MPIGVNIPGGISGGVPEVPMDRVPGGYLGCFWGDTTTLWVRFPPFPYPTARPSQRRKPPLGGSGLVRPRLLLGSGGYGGFGGRPGEAHLHEGLDRILPQRVFIHRGAGPAAILDHGAGLLHECHAGIALELVG